MDALFDDMADFLGDEYNIEDYDEDVDRLIQDVEQLEPPPVNIRERKDMVEIEDFDETNNMLNINVREGFRCETVYDETHLFTEPISTTNTMGGYISNVSFHERELIEELDPDDRIVMYRCNYGHLKYTHYIEPTKQKKTNRGRKKKEKKKKMRKKQGNGTDFNSQTTFVVRSTLSPDPGDGIIPASTKVYKFKVFRTGKIQLPGVHHHNIDDVIACAREIVSVLNFHLHTFEMNPAKISNLINVNPIMKNYKFIIKLMPGHIIDMRMLKYIIDQHNDLEMPEPGTAEFKELREYLADKTYYDYADLRPQGYPPVFSTKYSRRDTRLSIKFSTPIYKKQKKRTRINIFMRGRVNILGAFHAHATRAICDYLHWIIEMYYYDIVVPEGGVAEEEPPWEENIEQYSADDLQRILSDDMTILLPNLTEKDYDEACAFAQEVHREYTDAANDFLQKYLGDEYAEYFA